METSPVMAASMMADMQATRRRWEELNTERKEAMSQCCQPEKSPPFRPVFPVFPDAMGGTGIP